MLDEFVECHCRVQLWRFIWVRARTMLSRRFRGSSPSLAVKYSSRLVHSSLSPHLPKTVSISSRIFTRKRKCCEIERRTAASSNAHNRSRHTFTRPRRQATSPSSKHRRRYAEQTARDCDSYGTMHTASSTVPYHGQPSHCWSRVTTSIT